MDKTGDRKLRKIISEKDFKFKIKEEKEMSMNLDMALVNYQDILERGRRDLKKIENKGVLKLETLEDIRDTTGKSVRTSYL